MMLLLPDPLAPTNNVTSLDRGSTRPATDRNPLIRSDVSGTAMRSR